MQLFTLVITLIPLQSFAWIVAPKTIPRQVSAHVLFSTSNGNEAQVAGKGEHVHLGLDTQNPCWQDIFDNDCAMSTVYSASFVAKDWIRSMPCAEGIEVSLYLCRHQKSVIYTYIR